MSEAPLTAGVHHVGLTVPDLQQARSFFLDVLGFRQVGEVSEYPAVFLSDERTMITLWQVEDLDIAIPFDRKNVVGLHHVALAVGDHSALDRLHARLAAVDSCEIEFPPEPLGNSTTRHMMCYMPGGIRVEFIAPAND